jgi:hypothetical protein
MMLDFEKLLMTLLLLTEFLCVKVELFSEGVDSGFYGGYLVVAG